MNHSKDNLLKKVFRVLHSMKFGIVLLLIIGLFSIIGTLIPQNQTQTFYASNYKGIFYEIIHAFDLGRLYTSFWYKGLIGLLVVNLFFCSVRRFIPIFIRVIEKPDMDRILRDYESWDILEIQEGEIRVFAADLGFKNLQSQNLDGRTIYTQDKNSLGHLGSWITHVSLIIIILAFAIGRSKGYEVYVHGVPGHVCDVEGTDYQVQIDDFEMRLDQEGMTVSQYVTSMTLLKGGQPLESGQIMVNHPYRGEGISIYQNSTGWAINAKLYKNDQIYKEETLYNSEFFVEDNEKIVLQFVNFYPDFDMANPQAMRSLSPLLRHPVMLYALFYENQRVDMGLAHMGDEIAFAEYKFIVDEPQMFTLLQVNHDPGIPFAALGGLLQVFGMMLAFYFRPKKLRLVTQGETVWIWAKSHGNDNLFRDDLERKIKKWEGK